MSYSFNRAFEKLILIEGGYVDHPYDKGGKTKYGVTEVLKKALPNYRKTPIQDLTLDEAKDIYKKVFWDKIKGTEISAKSEVIAHTLFEIAVHRGVKPASEFFQKALNSFNRDEKDYKDIKEDGIIGGVTISSLEGLISKRKQADVNHVICTYILVEHAYLLNEASRKDKSQEAFMFGWYLKRIKIG